MKRAQDVSGCRALALALAAGIAAIPVAQGQTFQRAYGTQADEVANDIADLSECEYATIGNRTTIGAGTFVHGVRYDSNGTLIWSKMYNASQGTSAGYTLQQSRKDDLLFGAESTFGGTSFGKWILRVSPAGLPVWAILLPGTPLAGSISSLTPSLGVSVQELSDTSIASVNRIQDAASGARSGVLSLNAPTGLPAISYVYREAGNVDIREIDFADVREARLLLPASGAASPDLLIVGNIFDQTLNRYCALALRVSPAGAVIWSRKFIHPTPGISITADGMELASNGDILFSGRRGNAVRGQLSPTEMIVGRINANTGAMQWATDVDSVLNGYQAVRYNRFKEMIVAGTANLPVVGASVRSACLLTFNDSLGNWTSGEIYGSAAAGSDNRGNAVTLWHPWGGYGLAGSTNEAGIGQNDIYFVKTYTTLVSNCREREFKPDTRKIELLEKDITLQVTINAAATFLEPATLNVPLEQPIFCFEKRCVGDLNGDGLVDDADFSIFAVAYDALLCPTDPRFTCCPADFNGDGFVDDADFSLFVVAYDALLCP